MKLIAAWAFLPAASAFLPSSGPKGGPTRTRGVAFTIEMTARVDAPSPVLVTHPERNPSSTSATLRSTFISAPGATPILLDRLALRLGVSPLREQKGGSSVRPAAIEAGIPRFVCFVRPLPPDSLARSLASSADDRTTSRAAPGTQRASRESNSLTGCT
jgi:hypothetical protein